MKLKTLTLLILTAIVIASVACGPSAEEKRTLMLCEDALERRKNAETNIGNIEAGRKPAINQVQQFLLNKGLTAAINDQETLIEEAGKDIDKYCK
tara:strand:- start:141 stop:425 length:285 start_codon:yes stop_codon:yes gene_type:complete